MYTTKFDATSDKFIWLRLVSESQNG